MNYSIRIKIIGDSKASLTSQIRLVTLPALTIFTTNLTTSPMPLNNHFIYTPPQEPLRVLYEDDDIIVIDKPAGLLSVMGRLPEHHDSAYLRILEKHPTAKVTHRLDMATSGILMFAKHRDAEVAISKMFQVRTIKKNYIALVQGHLTGAGSIEVPLSSDWPNRPKQKVNLEDGKPAKTLYQPLAYSYVCVNS